MNTLRVSVVLFAFAIAASFAEETNKLPTTISVGGITYSNVTWGTVTLSTVSIFHRTGVATIPLEELPPELQRRFGYDAKKAAEYRAAEAAVLRAKTEREAAKRATTENAIRAEVKDLKNFPEKYKGRTVVAICNISHFGPIEYGEFQGNYGFQSEGVQARTTTAMEELQGENSLLVRHGDGIYLSDFFVIAKGATAIAEYCNTTMDGTHTYFANVYARVSERLDGKYMGEVLRIEFSNQFGKIYKAVECDLGLVKHAMKKVSFSIISDPLGAKIEIDGKLMGETPNVITYPQVQENVNATIRVTPCPVDRPMTGCLLSVPDFKLLLVLSNSPAAEMGMHVGDEIIAVNGVRVPRRGDSSTYREAISRSGFGGEVTFRVLRDGREVELRGRTIKRLSGTFYVQERVIRPASLDNQTLYFDLREPTGQPVQFGAAKE